MLFTGWYIIYFSFWRFCRSIRECVCVYIKWMMCNFRQIECMSVFACKLNSQSVILFSNPFGWVNIWYDALFIFQWEQSNYQYFSRWLQSMRMHTNSTSHKIWLIQNDQMWQCVLVVFYVSAVYTNVKCMNAPELVHLAMNI